jgi:hypothetical protein
MSSRLGKEFSSFCYEHYLLSVRQGETIETEGLLLRRSYLFALMDSWLG